MLTIQTLMTCLSEESTIGKTIAQIDSLILNNAYEFPMRKSTISIVE